MLRLAQIFCLAALTHAVCASPFQGKPPERLLAAGSKHVLMLSGEGKTLWEYPTALTHDVWLLPSGNVLFADGASVTEVTPEKKVVFKYQSEQQKGGGTYACQRLENGRTMVGENSTGRVLEVDPAGKVVFTLQTSPFKPGEHHNLRMVRKLANGNYLVCHSGARVVKEYTPKGDVVWQVTPPGRLAFAAVRTPKGTTFVSSLEQVTEYDAAGKVLWQCTREELAEGKVTNLTGMHLLPNGNLAIGCYQAYKNGEGCGLFEITREKKFVWRYCNPSSDGTMMAVQVLDAHGKALPGVCQR